MKRESASQFALFDPRALVALLICGVAASSILSGAQLAFFCSEAPANSSQRTLTFAERVAYQRAIRRGLLASSHLAKRTSRSQAIARCGDHSGAVGKESRRLSAQFTGPGKLLASADHS